MPYIHPIRSFRTAAGMTQSQLAATIGVRNKGTVSAWEVGYSRPDPETAKRLCSALPGLTLDQVYSKPTLRRARATPGQRLEAA